MSVILSHAPCATTRITSPFGSRTNPVSGRAEHHNGIDLSPVDKIGESIYAIANGRVFVSKLSASGGEYIVIDHNNGYYSEYMHMRAGSRTVTAGQTVFAGAVIGRMGATGQATGEHLHFQIDSGWRNPVDPEPLLAAIWNAVPPPPASAATAGTADTLSAFAVPTEKTHLIYQVSSIPKGDYYPDVIDAADYAGSFGKMVDRVYLHADAGDVYYRVRTGNRFLPEVKNREDFAGIKGKPITAFALRTTMGKARYRAHVIGGNWLPWVDGYDVNDSRNGYAGNGQPIDALQAEIV